MMNINQTALHFVVLGWDDNLHIRTVMVFEKDCDNIAWNFYENEQKNWYGELQRMEMRGAAEWEFELHVQIAPSITAIFMPHVEPRDWDAANDPVQIRMEIFGVEPEFCYSSEYGFHQNWLRPAPWQAEV